MVLPVHAWRILHPSVNDGMSRMRTTSAWARKSLKRRMKAQIVAAAGEDLAQVDVAADALIDLFDHFWMVHLSEEHYPRLLGQVRKSRNVKVMSLIGDSRQFERTVCACYMFYCNHERGFAKCKLVYHRFVHAVVGSGPVALDGFCSRWLCLSGIE